MGQTRLRHLNSTISINLKQATQKISWRRSYIYHQVLLKIFLGQLNKKCYNVTAIFSFLRLSLISQFSLANSFSACFFDRIALHQKRNKKVFLFAHFQNSFSIEKFRAFTQIKSRVKNEIKDWQIIQSSFS